MGWKVANDDIEARLARLEENQRENRRNIERIDAWQNEHDNWANGAKDKLFDGIAQARRECDVRSAKLERDVTELDRKLSGIGSRVLAAQIAGSIFVAVVTVIAAAVAIFAGMK